MFDCSMNSSCSASIVECVPIIAFLTAESIYATGATSFLFTEYQYVGVFMVAFAILIFVFLGSVEGFSTKSQACTYDSSKMCKPALATAIFSTTSFLLGAVTSVISGFLGMKIATYANARTTLEARKGVGKAFIVAFRSGAVMGFLLAANGLLVLYIAINLFKLYYGDDWEGLFEAITGYGLGGSSMALFGRVGGGIYTKAADVGADLVGKVERNIPEDDPRNPAVSLFCHLNGKMCLCCFFVSFNVKYVLRLLLTMSVTMLEILLGWDRIYLDLTQSHHVLPLSLLLSPHSESTMSSLPCYILF